MKKIHYTLGLLAMSLALVLASCDNEDTPTPSMADKDRLTELTDLSKPLVKEFKENYNVSILYQFDDTLDFKFGFYTTASNSIWNKIEVTHLEDEEQVDFALEKLDEMVMQYFKDDFRKLLPRKILLADIVETSSGIPDSYVGESNQKESGEVTAIGSPYTYLFAFDKASMSKFSSTQLLRLRNVKLYNLICHVMENHDLYKSIPEEFYTDVTNLHGESVNTQAESEATLPVGTGPYANYYTPDWYMGLGMALTENSPAAGASTNYRMRLRTSSSMTFPDKELDFRNFLCVMIFTKKSDLQSYYVPSELFCQRMRIAMQTVEDWGIDILKINPDLEVFNK